LQEWGEWGKIRPREEGKGQTARKDARSSVQAKEVEMQSKVLGMGGDRGDIGSEELAS
jgi:hypothetical protein